MRALRLLIAVAFLYSLVAPVDVAAQQIGASLRAGTGGVGVGLGTQITETLNGRVDVSYFTYGSEGTEVREDVSVDWTGEGNLLFVSALGDWHPFKNAFRLSAGAMYNGLEGSGSAVPAGDMVVGSNTYSPEEVGSLEVDVNFGSKIAPYLGLGIGNTVTRRFGFLFDLGVIYAGSPDVNVRATGMLAPTASEAPQLEQNLEWVQWYPILSLGFNVRLN